MFFNLHGSLQVREVRTLEARGHRRHQIPGGYGEKRILPDEAVRGLHPPWASCKMFPRAFSYPRSSLWITGWRFDGYLVTLIVKVMEALHAEPSNGW